MTTHRPPYPDARWGWIALLLSTWLVRLQRLSWQPLWWDEGYSVYFATEPLPRMVALTAADIHPPLYYTLLHYWIRLGQNVHPASLRLFSAMLGVAGILLLVTLARRLFPQQRRITWLTGLLLAVSPLHLYYSQEVRMYGLAMATGLACSLTAWSLYESLQRQSEGRRSWPWGLLALYGLSAAVALYTLYYLALLLLAHALWFVWQFRRQSRALLAVATAFVLALLLYLPWLLYSLPRLISYVAAKVPADADQPLGLLAYLSRHWLAFTSGHLDTSDLTLQIARWFAAAAPLLVAFTGRWSPRSNTSEHTHRALSAQQFLLCSFLIPMAVAFGLNLRLPFFPVGGERLLLFVLPYALLLVAEISDRSWRTLWHGPLILLALLIGAAAGGWIFFSTPRYSDENYRPLIRQIVQESASEDSVAAIFPWMAGYWRVYSMETACQTERTACTLRHGIDEVSGPHLHLLGNQTLVWNADLQAALTTMLQRGTLWLPTPLGLGSTLPAEIEAFLTGQAVNVENRWLTPTTRLSAWRQPSAVTTRPIDLDFGPVQLSATGLSTGEVVSANHPIIVQLAWETTSPEGLGVTLRLLDQQRQTWASRTYSPLGRFAHATDGGPLIEQAGLRIPTGLPPGIYTVAVGVVVSATQQLLPPAGSTTAATQITPVGALTVTTPDAPQPGYRAPIETPLTPPAQLDGVALLGVSGLDDTSEQLAGDGVDITLFLQARQPQLADRWLDVSLVAANGARMAGWQGQTPSGWPPDAWPDHALVQAPVHFFTPATLPAGIYQVIAGFAPTGGGQVGQTVAVGRLIIYQRPRLDQTPAMAHHLSPPPELGSHVRLLGYDQSHQGQTLVLTLYWEVLQPLLPPHHLFVHLDNADGVTLAQADGPPQMDGQRAPTGSWRPGEFLITQHILHLPTHTTAVTLQVGLYEPVSGVRLPVSVGGQTIGDAIALPVAP
jgi:4-amino-4-deoxy-L-arabinose transferase-like glycosyltransferase